MAISQTPHLVSLKPRISSSSKPLFGSVSETLRAATMSGLSRLRPLAAQLLSLRRLSSRAYGSAAAQLQYDSDYYDEEEQQLQQHGLVETEGSVPGRGVKWVLIGHRGVQRRVYAERLSKLLEVPHISMGSLVRQELHPSSSLYKQIANAVNEGKLVLEEIIFTLLSRRLEEGYCRGETGFILDGIPRTRMQAEILNQIAHIDLVVNFKCTEDHLVKNNLGAGNFSPCRKYLSMSNAGCNLNLMFQNKQLKTSPTDIGGSWRESFIFIQSRVRHWKITIGKQQRLLDFHVGSAPGETWIRAGPVEGLGRILMIQRVYKYLILCREHLCP